MIAWISFVTDRTDDVARVESSLDTIIPENANQPYDMKELILKVADEGDFYEIQEEHAKNIITGFIRLEGQTVGIVANQPIVRATIQLQDPSSTQPNVLQQIYVRYYCCFFLLISYDY